VKRVLIVLGAALVVAGGAAAALWVRGALHPADVRGSATHEFETTQAPGATTRPEPEVKEEPWPLYGFDSARTRFANDFHERPPFRLRWTFRSRDFVEFPPIIAYGKLYFATFKGKFFAVDAETGDLVWQKDLGRPTAASPAVADGIIYQPLFGGREEDRARKQPSLLALDAETGRELWTFRAGASESSPLVRGGTVYYGTFDDKIYAVDAKTGHVRWSFKTGGDVKGGPVFWHGTIYSGAYDGKVYALYARTGKLRWVSSSQGSLRGSGTFYATPAVAYGRVFVGNTDGKMYAFGARTGDLLWSKSTGGYVYSAASVWNKTVFFGSYDHHFYALDAATGDVRWSFDAKKPISGSSTVLEGLVYFPSFARKTYALDARSGKLVWTLKDGLYSSPVADETKVYVTGAGRIYAFEPTS
jgi:outer membrane protein assembly factor BamB